uniref:Uncharacterized protein n=1 Tax=viral metagenome TaxID=1070528 RepID=A0A6M3XGN7_9ZZZZ
MTERNEQDVLGLGWWIEDGSVLGARIVHMNGFSANLTIPGEGDIARRLWTRALELKAENDRLRKAEGERLLKLAPETPGGKPRYDDTLREPWDATREVLLQPHDVSGAPLPERSISARLANLEEVTAMLDKRLALIGMAYDRHRHTHDGTLQNCDATPVLLGACACEKVQGFTRNGYFTDYRSPIGTRCPIHGECQQVYDENPEKVGA